MDKKTKTVYTLAPPFPEPQWYANRLTAILAESD